MKNNEMGGACGTVGEKGEEHKWLGGTAWGKETPWKT